MTDHRRPPSHVAQGRRHRRPPRRGPRADRRPSTGAASRCHALRRPRTARSTTTARTRAARSARARSRTGWLRCPWHGYDYDPTDRPTAGGVHRRADRASRSRCAPTASTSRCPTPPDAARTRLRRAWSRRWSRGASTHVFGMVGHSNLGFADALRTAEERGELTLRRHPPRGRGRVRGLGLRQAHRAPGGVLRASPGRARPTCSPASTTPRLDRAPVLAISGQVPVEGAGPGRVPGRRPDRGVPRRRRCRRSRCSRAPTTPSWPRTAVKHALDGRGVAHLVLPDEVQDLPSDAPAGAPLGRRADLAVAPSAGDAGRRAGPAARPPAAR